MLKGLFTLQQQKQKQDELLSPDVTAEMSHHKNQIERDKLSEPQQKKGSQSSQKTLPFFFADAPIKGRVVTTMAVSLSLLLPVQPLMRSTRTDLTRGAEEQTSTRPARSRSLQPSLR